jgi:dimethylargininase
VRCELTHLARAPIDPERAAEQHSGYEQALARLGCTIEHLPPEPELPDSVFVEDTAIVLDECAVITLPGASSRRAETASVAAALGAYRPLKSIEPPATLDGGDVLRVGRRLFVGLSARTNGDGARQLREHLMPLGYTVESVQPRDCLHLKSAATAIADDLLLINPSWVDGASFVGLSWIEIDPSEPFAANVLRIGSALVCSAGFQRTQQRLEASGFEVVALEMSELAKAEGAVTCCSLIFRA